MNACDSEAAVHSSARSFCIFYITSMDDSPHTLRNRRKSEFHKEMTQTKVIEKSFKSRNRRTEGDILEIRKHLEPNACSSLITFKATNHLNTRSSDGSGHFWNNQQKCCFRKPEPPGTIVCDYLPTNEYSRRETRKRNTEFSGILPRVGGHARGKTLVQPRRTPGTGSQSIRTSISTHRSRTLHRHQSMMSSTPAAATRFVATAQTPRFYLQKRVGVGSCCCFVSLQRDTPKVLESRGCC